MKKKIVLPTDFSKNADNAINYAIELYKEESCEFFILHSYYLPGYNKSNLLSLEPTEERLKEVKERAEENMEKLKALACFNDENSNHSFYFLNEFGPFNEVIKNIVEKNDIKLIIMGTHGETDDENIILGRNAVNVMEKVRECPVLTIPNNIIFKQPNEIVFPTSFKTHYKESELATLIEISQLANAPIRILHIQTEKALSKNQEEKKELLNQILKAASYTHHQLFNLDLQEGVRCFSQSRQSEMIAFINKKHHFFESIFSNPMVKDLGNNAHVPVLALHDLKD
ncbi:universal stress protein [Polaribacter glomeratus]|uniref:Universal stress protein UspA n=1 Tax=Polaribacter glomeratus TaxID=102 RepID=A0A2S7WFB4_9FLAO|nr:universal stress protein [Polaribacter glomeratus]PQJ76287.1 universal stress protein UspA [Polaribacter glomeratus]TXD63797.1 universal stress protein [Polaribacter glomeratus]